MFRIELLLGAGIAFLGVAIGAYFYGHHAGIQSIKADMAVKIQQAEQKARKEEQAKQETVNATLQTQADNLASINARQSRELERLRKRPSRRHMSKTTKTNCSGATGANLSRPDAEFLTREATRADTLREALKACYSYADTVVK